MMTVRWAILSDIHGNVHALRAVLADLATHGALDGMWILGDHVLIGPDPAAVAAELERLDAVLTRGNTEEMLFAMPDQPVVAFARRQLGERIGRFADLPTDVRLTLPDGTRVLGVHARPGAVDGNGFHDATSDADARALLGDCAADLVFVGHTHAPHERRVDSVHVVNQGAVGLSWGDDVRASYALLEADADGYRVTLRRVAYDGDAVSASARAGGHPDVARIEQFMRGEMQPPWRAGGR